MAEDPPPALQEFDALTPILQAIPHKSHKGLFTQQEVDWTCIDVSEDFLAVGTNVGVVYLYERAKNTVQKLQCPIKKTVVCFVKIKESVDNVVAMATTCGLLYIFVLPSILPGRNKQLQVFPVQGMHHSSIKCVQWSQNAMKLFSGDEDGVVICTELDYQECKSESYLVCKEPHEVVQLGYSYKTLLVSTRFRTFVIQPGNPDSLAQVGQKDRKSLGPYGAVFLPGVYQSKDAVLFATRPGLRLWKANIEGVVQATYIFRDLLTGTQSGLSVLPDTTNRHVTPRPEDQQFGPLLIYEETKLVTFHQGSLFVIDPGLGTFLGYHCCLGPILDVSVCGDEVFILRPSTTSGRILLRLAQKPLLGMGSRGIPQTLPLGPEANGGTLSYDQYSDPNSPVHILSVTASKMSTSIVGAFKDLGEKISSVQEGQKETGKPPPWGPGGREESPAKSALQRVDSAKEPSPESGPTTPLAKEVDSAQKVEQQEQELEEQAPPGAPPIVRLDGCDTLKVEIPATSSGIESEAERIASTDRSSLTPERDRSSLTPERTDFKIQRFEVLGQESFDDIVYSSSRVKKHKKKKPKPGKDKDTSSVASLEIFGPQGSPVNSGNASPRSPRSRSPRSNSRGSSPHPGPSGPPTMAVTASQPSSAVPTDAGNVLVEKVADVSKESSSETPLLSATETVVSQGIDTAEESSQSPVVKASTGTVLNIDSSDKTDPSAVSSSAHEGGESSQTVHPGEPVHHAAPLKLDIAAAASVLKTSTEKRNTPPTATDKKTTSIPGKDVNTGSGHPPGLTLPDQGSQPTLPAGGSQPSSLQSLPLQSPNIQPQPAKKREPDYPQSPTEDFYTMYKSDTAPSIRNTGDHYDSPHASIQDFMEHTASTGGSRKETTAVPQDLHYTLLDTWGEFPAPSALQSLCLSERVIWCTDRAEHLYYSSLVETTLKWKKVENAPAKQISASPSGWVVWRLHRGSIFVGTKLTTNRVSTNTKWMEVAKEVAFISVDETYAWYAKLNGDVYMQKGLSRDRPCYRSIKVACPHRVLQVVCRRGVVWALTEDRNLLVRTGVQPGKEEGADWKFLQGGGPSLLVSNFDIGDGNTAWVMDLLGRVWFTTSVSRTTPQGSGQWWQVPMSEYLMHDSSARDILKTMSKVPQTLVKLVQSEDKGGLISVGENGVWVCPGHRTTLHVCRASMLGHQWELAIPHGMLPSTVWDQISATAADEEDGLIWAQQPNGEIFSFCPSSLRPTEVIPPKPGVAFLSLSATEDAVWGVLPGGTVTVRGGMAPHCTHGLKWEQLDLQQLGSTTLTHVNCGTQNVWALDSRGLIYLRIGVKPSSRQGLNPAWVPVEGTTHTLGAKFIQVFSGPNDWMVWALDSKKTVYVRKGITDAMPIGTHWVQVGGSSAESIAISERLVYALTSQGELLVRYGITPENPSGNYWKKIPGVLGKISVTAEDTLWGVSKDGQLCRRYTYYLKRQHALPDLDQSQARLDSIGDDWEVI